jgi:hypothetical protein
MNDSKNFIIWLLVLLISTTIFSFFSQAKPVVATPELLTNTWHVAPSGSDTSACGSSQSPCRSIQYTVEKAASGDTIKVAAGTYTYTSASNRCSDWYGSNATGVVCIDRKHITLLGGFTTSNWHDSNPTTNLTVIDGQNNHRGVFVLETTVAPTSLHMEGFTIRNGRARSIPTRSGKDAIYAFGGGMLVERATVTLRHVIFEHNQAIGENTATSYGGGGIGGGLSVRNAASSHLEHVTFRYNTARGGSGTDRGGFGIGGGLYTFNTVVTGSYITATNNLSVGGNSNGSGFSENNKADGQGGGLAIQINSRATFQHLTVTDNETRGGNALNGSSGGAFGGGIFVEEASLTIMDSLIKNNLARGGNGKNEVSNPFSMGGGISTTRSNLTIERAEIINNTVRGGDSERRAGSAGGGGVGVHRLVGNTQTIIKNTIIGSNLAAMGAGPDKSGGGGGGGLSLNGAEAFISHTTFANNRLGESHMQGSGMLLFSFAANTPGTAQVDYTIFANHSHGHALHVQAENAGNQATLYEGLFDNNDSNTSNFGNISGLETMISGPAHFVDAAALNFRIQGNSAARDATSSSTLPEDVDREKRDNVPDIGASEYIPRLPEFSDFQAAPVASGVLNVSWQGDNMGGVLDRYILTITCPAGSNPPDQMACGSPTNMGTVTTIQLTGLTDFQSYTLTIKAYDNVDNLLAEAHTTAVPTNIFIYLPMVQR